MIRIQQSAYGLGSELMITLIAQNQEQTIPIFKELWSMINAFEKRFSRFIEHSELSNVNKNAGQKTKITSEFKQLLIESQKLGQQTNGLFNPLILPSLQKAGYIGSWPKPNNFKQSLDYSKRSNHPIKDIELNDDSITIPKNTALDFGGIGKGYLLEKLSAKLNKHNIKSYWISLGGDILCQGYDADNIPWAINIDSADDNITNAGTIRNLEGQKIAIASSGITKRKGNNWHHIINPETKKPAETDILVATVACGNATEADVMAKTLVILGSKKAEKLFHDNIYYAVALQIVHNDNVKIKKFGNID